MAEQSPPPEQVAALGRDGAGRRAPVAGGLLALQQLILTAFAQTGRQPARDAVTEVARPFGRSACQILRDLAAADFIGLDSTGGILAAYPFSAVATPHRVLLPSGVETYAMCAVDALGIPPMLGCDAIIASADPVTTAPITVRFVNGQAQWSPAEAVVWVGRRSCKGPALAVCCHYLNFFENCDTARKWADGHPEIIGGIASQADAVRLGRDIFGDILLGSSSSRVARSADSG